MYSDVLKFHFYLNIPHGITAAFLNIYTRKKSNKKIFKRKNNVTAIPSFIDVLESLVGSDIRLHLGEL